MRMVQMGGFLLMERREEEVRRRRDRSSVGQTESWRAEDKRGEGDRGCVCVFGGVGGGIKSKWVRGFGCREHIHQGSFLVSNWSDQR